MRVVDYSNSSLARVMGHPKQAEWESVAHVCSKVARALEKNICNVCIKLIKLIKLII